MKRIGLALLFFVAFSMLSPLRQAQAACVLASGTVPATGLPVNTGITLTLIGGHSYRFFANNSSGGMVGFVGTGIPPAPSPKDYTFLKPSTSPFSLKVGGDGPGSVSYSVTDLSADCGGGGTVTFFAPGDGRIDPRPGDRIAVYCTTAGTPPTFDVILINNSNGIATVHFDYAALKPAGKTGLMVSPAGDVGTVAASVDAGGNFFATWVGGQYSATGQGDFAKLVQCHN